MTVTIRLTYGQISMASHIAVMRHTSNIIRDVPPKHGPLHENIGFEINVRSLCAEVAVARYLNLFWCGTVGDFKARDVGGMVEVRNALEMTHRLRLHETDNDDVPFVAAFAQPPNVELRGWLFAREGKQTQFWCDPSANGGRPAYFVSRKLRDVPSLRDWVDDHVRSHFLEQGNLNGQAQRINS